MPKRSLMLTRFWEKVEETDDCWLWTAAQDNKGYGCFQVMPRTLVRAHVMAWILHHRREVPSGLQIDHLCHVRNCVNPDHLEAVTPWVNNDRKRNSPGQRTHCPRGHAYDGDNLAIWTDKRGYTHRICRTCRIVRSRAWQKAHAS